jgi:hypothetical protein
MKRVAIVQSSYIPWRGYFDIIGQVDEFVLYDSVQFTKRDWRNRNRIKTVSGPLWLTIPVATAGAFTQSVADTRISDPAWAAAHWRSIEHAYARAPYFDEYRGRWQERFRECAGEVMLSRVNRRLLEAVASELGFRTVFTDAAAYPVTGDRNSRLVDICRAAGATTYLSGPSARVYLDVEQFRAAGILVEFMDYSGYREYPQLHGPFEPSVSILDLLFNVGPEAPAYLSPASRRPS